MIAVLGGSGPTGSAVLATLVSAGERVLALGRDQRRLAASARTAGPHAGSVGARGAPSADASGVDATAADALAAVLEGVDLLVVAGGPATSLVPPALEAALRRGIDVVVLSGDPWLLRELAARDGSWRAAGRTAVVGVALEPWVSDLLVDLAASAVAGPREVHVASIYPDRGGWRAAATPGTRRALADAVGRGSLALLDGELVEEPIGEARRLAWFPRPVGPSHAAGVPGAAPTGVPAHVPGVRTVRSYLAVPGWRAELLQFAGNAARWGPAGQRLAAHVAGAGVPPTDPARWGVVAEVAGTGRVRGAERDAGDVGALGPDRGEIARAWAHGSHPPEAGAAAVLATVRSVLAGRAAPGVVPASLAGVPAELLDACSATGLLRWSLARPPR